MERNGKRRGNNVGLGYCVKEIYRKGWGLGEGGGGVRMKNNKFGG